MNIPTPEPRISDFEKRLLAAGWSFTEGELEGILDVFCSFLPALPPTSHQPAPSDWPNDNGRVVDAAGNTIESPLLPAPISSAPDGAGTPEKVEAKIETPVGVIPRTPPDWAQTPAREIEYWRTLALDQTNILKRCMEAFGWTSDANGYALWEAITQLRRKLSELEQQRDALKRECEQLQARVEEDKAYYKMKHDELVSENRSVVDLRRLLDDSNGRVHQLRSMLREAGFPDRVKWGEDLHGNEEFVQVRVECQMKDALTKLASLTAASQEVEGLKALLGMDTPWPIETLLKALVIAETRLRETGRDFDGWESIQTAASVARARLADKGTEGKS